MQGRAETGPGSDPGETVSTRHRIEGRGLSGPDADADAIAIAEESLDRMVA